MFWNKHEETISRKKLEELQLRRLRALLKNTSEHPVYKQYKNVRITKLSDLQKLPFTAKKDIQRFSGFEFFNSPIKDIVRVHSTAGTTSKPIMVGYTKKDIATWSELAARIFAAGDLTTQDIVQNALNYGLFTEGLGMQLGVEKIGAAILPSGGNNTLRQINLIQNLGVTALLSTPSYAFQIMGIADKHALDIKNSKLKLGFFTSETWTEKMRQEIETAMKIKALDNYSLTEVFGPGIAYECLHQNGMHVSEDHFIVEVIDPVSEEVLSPGEKGELVFTTLTKQGFPVIRFRTGDISRLLPDRCSCGRTFQRIERIAGRNDDKFVINGIDIFPSQIKDVLGDEPYATFNYEIIIEREDHKDLLTVLVETPHLLQKHSQEILLIEKEMSDRLRASVGVKVKIKLLKPGAIMRFSEKQKQVIDTRRK
ncbi:MAG: phenylacetate--CoA ligase [archaeon]